jgi:hypothetical protein
MKIEIASNDVPMDRDTRKDAKRLRGDSEGAHLSARYSGLNAKERREVAGFYLKLVGLERFMHATIHQLSGGHEAARCARPHARTEPVCY